MNLVITSINEQHENKLINDFLPTLLFFFNGKIAIIDYGLSKEAFKYLNKFDNIIIKKFEATEQIVNIRFKHVPIFLNQLDAKNVMMIDSGDVWFQDNFEEVFDLCNNLFGCVENNDLGCKNWIRKIGIILPEKYKKIFEFSVSKPILEAGMICGTKEKVINITQKTYEMIKEINLDKFGIDMIALNILVRKNTIPFKSLSSTYNYNISSHPSTILKNEFVCTESGKKIKIAHNTDDNPKFFRKSKN